MTNVALPELINISMGSITPPYRYKPGLAASFKFDDPNDHARRCLDFRARYSSRGEDEYYRSRSAIQRYKGQQQHSADVHALFPKYSPAASSPRRQSMSVDCSSPVATPGRGRSYAPDHFVALTYDGWTQEADRAKKEAAQATVIKSPVRPNRVYSRQQSYHSPKPLHSHPETVHIVSPMSSPRRSLRIKMPEDEVIKAEYRKKTTKPIPQEVPSRCLPLAPLLAEESMYKPTTPDQTEPDLSNSTRFREFLQVCKSVTALAPSNPMWQEQRKTRAYSDAEIPSVVESEHSESTGFLLYDMKAPENMSSYTFDDTTRSGFGSVVEQPVPETPRQQHRRSNLQRSELAEVSRPSKPNRPSLQKSRATELVSTRTVNDDDSVTVEVAPGEFMPVRSAQETNEAIQRGFYKSCVCICCNQVIFCILDASFILCPDCRSVSRASDADPKDSKNSGGVGLGFKL